MKRKTFYEAPETELILVRFEENIMSPNGFNENQHTEYLEEEDGGNL